MCIRDRVYSGSPLPIASGGITSSLEWKNFDLNMLFSYVIGRHILNAGKGASVGTRLGMTIEDTATPIFANLDKISFWQKPGDRTDFPANRLENGLSNFATNLYSNVEDVSYIKLKTITLGYTLPSNIASRIGVGARTVSYTHLAVSLTGWRWYLPLRGHIVTAQ